MCHLSLVFQLEFGAIFQTGAGIGSGVLTLRDPEFPAVETICLLTGPICHAHEDHAFVVLLGRNNETRAWFGLG